jgi:hypothetical protein
MDRAAERAAGFIRRTARREPKAGRGPRRATGPYSFPVTFLQITVLLFFAQILGKFQIVFSIQIIPTKNLFREFKSYRFFLKRLKLMNFLIHVSAAYS